MSRLALMPGDIVKVRSAKEVLGTLDADGCLDQLPFMQEMLAYCGKQYAVLSRADKTCDTVNKTGGRRLFDTVHLDSSRCDGSAHDGCQATCLIFWKEAWLEKVGSHAANSGKSENQGAKSVDSEILSRFAISTDGSGLKTYRCQTTQLPIFTSLLPWWDVRQYVRDIRTGNASIGRIVKSFSFSIFRKLLGVGVGYKFLLASYNRFQRTVGGREYPLVRGTLDLTPSESLNIQPGEYVRIKPLAEINRTLNKESKNKGMWFDQEMVRYCDGTYKVAKRVSRIINERTGEMTNFGTPSLLLENVVCRSEVSDRRLFCPRRIHSFWREIWVERAENPDKLR